MTDRVQNKPHAVPATVQNTGRTSGASRAKEARSAPARAEASKGDGKAATKPGKRSDLPLPPASAGSTKSAGQTVASDPVGGTVTGNFEGVDVSVFKPGTVLKHPSSAISPDVTGSWVNNLKGTTVDFGNRGQFKVNENLEVFDAGGNLIGKVMNHSARGPLFVPEGKTPNDKDVVPLNYTWGGQIAAAEPGTDRFVVGDVKPAAGSPAPTVEDLVKQASDLLGKLNGLPPEAQAELARPDVLAQINAILDLGKPAGSSPPATPSLEDLNRAGGEILGQLGDLPPEAQAALADPGNLAQINLLLDLSKPLDARLVSNLAV